MVELADITGLKIPRQQMPYRFKSAITVKVIDTIVSVTLTFFMPRKASTASTFHIIYAPVIIIRPQYNDYYVHIIPLTTIYTNQFVF